VRHLLLCSLRPPGAARESRWLGEDEEIVLGTAEDPLPHLATLAGIYWAGLSRPVPLFPEASLVYVERLQKGQSEAQALSAARTVWNGSEFSPKIPEGQDPYHRLAFRGPDPLDGEFERLAREVFLPALEHRRP
jgi:exodeoxyribonuclease V gamma subunit